MIIMTVDNERFHQQSMTMKTNRRVHFFIPPREKETKKKKSQK